MVTIPALTLHAKDCQLKTPCINLGVVFPLPADYFFSCCAHPLIHRSNFQCERRLGATYDAAGSD